MRLLVTGPTGFVGRNVCAHLLAEGHELRGLTRPGRQLPEGVTPVIGDLTVPESLKRPLEKVEAVVHLGAVRQANRESLYRRVNAEGTRNLGLASIEAGVKRMVFISGISAQGPSPTGRPHTQAGSEAPVTEYGRSKLAGEQSLAHDCPSLPVTVLRPCAVYGPYDRSLYTFGHLARRGVLPLLPEMELSLLHVGDLAALISAVLRSRETPFGPFFVSDGNPVLTSRLIDLIESSMGGGPVLRVPIPRGLLNRVGPALRAFAEASGLGYRAARLMADLAAPGWTCAPWSAMQVFDWKPSRALDEALPAAFRWYREAGWIQ